MTSGLYFLVCIRQKTSCYESQTRFFFNFRSVHPRTTRYILNSNEHMESQTAARLWNKYERSSFCAGETCREIIKGVGLSVDTSVSKIYEGIIVSCIERSFFHTIYYY